MLLAVLDTLEQADVWLVHVRLASVEGSIILKGGGLLGVAMLLVEAELGLDGGAMDAESVETLSGSSRKLHILLTAVGVDGE